MEIGGTDLGVDPATHTGNPSGFVENFSFSALHIGPGAHVFLADAFDNSAGGPDALYVDSIVFDDPAGVLNLNGLNLYYNSISGSAGQIINTLVSIPEPSSASFAIASGLCFFIPRRRKSIFLHS